MHRDLSDVQGRREAGRYGRARGRGHDDKERCRDAQEGFRQIRLLLPPREENGQLRGGRELQCKVRGHRGIRQARPGDNSAET